MIKKNISGIYKIENKNNGKVYIGCSFDIEARFSAHRISLNNNKHHSSHLQSAWNKYGEDSFEFSIVEYFGGNREELLKKEAYWGDFYKVNDNRYGYNMMTCGTDINTNFKHSKETKERLKMTWKLKGFIKKEKSEGLDGSELKDKVFEFLVDNEYPDSYFENIDKFIAKKNNGKKIKYGYFCVNESGCGTRFDIDKKIEIKEGAVKMISSIKNKRNRHIFYTLYALSIYHDSDHFCFLFSFLREHSGFTNYNYIVKSLNELQEDGLIKYKTHDRESVIEWIKRDESGRVVTTIKPNTRLIDHPTLDKLYIL